MSIPITTAIGRVQPRYLGEYNSSLNYEKLDNVLYDGCTYVALKNVPAGQVPGSASSSYWQLIANKGNTGGFDTPKASASALAAGQTPTVKITQSGPDTAKIFSFEFGIPAGPTGPIGFHTISADASALPVGANPTVNATRTEDSGNINIDFQFGIPAAEGQGAVSVDNITLDQNRNVNLTAVRAVQSQILTEDQKGYARDNIGAVPVSRTINGKSLASDITLSAENVGAVPTERTVNSKNLSSNITLTATDVGAVNSALKINGKSINNPTESGANITLGVSDISGAVSTVAGVSPDSSGNVSLTASNVGAIENKAGAITSNHLSSNSVTSAKIANTAVTTEKIADVAVTESKIESNAVTTQKIKDGAVTNSKLAANSVNTSNLYKNSVTREKLAKDALYSPLEQKTSSYTFSVDDIGKTILSDSSQASQIRILTLNATTNDDMPIGAELAIMAGNTGVTKLSVEKGIGIRGNQDGTVLAKDGMTAVIPRYCMVALKKFFPIHWVITGVFEVES